MERGGLGAAVRACSARALKSGALEPIETDALSVADGGIVFSVRVATNLARRDAARRRRPRAGGNPFLPYDEALFVADLSPTHVCLLNRFNVLDGHALIVTRAFEDQAGDLTRADFAALALCLDEIDGVGFFNGGADAGASQRHKHLQILPAPLGAGPRRTPIDDAVDEAHLAGGVGAAPRLPFRHALARTGPSADLAATWRALRRALAPDREPRAFNLVATRDWMLAVPRVRERCRRVSVNALGFAGALFAPNLAARDEILRRGPMALLRSVALPREDD